MVNIDYDAEYARRVQAAENEQISAQLAADEQARIAAAESQKATDAQQKLAEMQAANAASMSALDAGAAGYGFSASGELDLQEPQSSGSSGVALAVLAGLAAFALLGRPSREGR